MEPNSDSSPCKTGERNDSGEAPSTGGRPATASRNARSQKPCLNASALRLAKNLRLALRRPIRLPARAAERSAYRDKPGRQRHDRGLWQSSYPVEGYGVARQRHFPNLFGAWQPDLAFAAPALRRVRRPRTGGNVGVALAFDHGDVVPASQVQPKLRASAKVAPRRTEVSAVTERRPFKMSVIRPDGPPM
jgi:hypothetical protein